MREGGGAGPCGVLAVGGILQRVAMRRLDVGGCAAACVFREGVRGMFAAFGAALMPVVLWRAVGLAVPPLLRCAMRFVRILLCRRLDL